MTIFEKVKNSVKPKELAETYLGEPYKKNGNTWFYYSPLRLKERTASLAVNDNKGFTDFGTGRNYDIISFIAELFNCNLKEACIEIANKFNIDIGYTQNKKTLEILKKQNDEQLKIQAAINKWFEDKFNFFTNMFKEYRNLKFSVATNSNTLPYIYKQEQLYESLVDIFLDNSTQNKILLYKNKERFDKYDRERGNV